MSRFALAIFTILIATQISLAQGPPTFTDTPIFLGLEGRGLRTFGKFLFKKSGNIYVLPVAVPYNIRTNLLIGGVVPFIRKSLEGINSKAGLGDVSVFIKYLVLQKDEVAKTFRVALKLQETFPTGNSTSMPSLGLAAHQTYLGLVSGYITTKLGIYTELGYNGISKNIDDTIVYNLAFGFPFLPVSYPPKQVNLYVGFNGSSILGEKRTMLFLSSSKKGMLTFSLNRGKSVSEEKIKKIVKDAGFTPKEIRFNKEAGEKKKEKKMGTKDIDNLTKDNFRESIAPEFFSRS